MMMTNRDGLTVCCQEETARAADQCCVPLEPIHSGDVRLTHVSPHICYITK